MVDRRGFLKAILASGVAPYVVTTAGVLMPVRAIATELPRIEVGFPRWVRATIDDNGDSKVKWYTSHDGEVWSPAHDGVLIRHLDYTITINEFTKGDLRFRFAEG